jgi:hypothetical protein
MGAMQSASGPHRVCTYGCNVACRAAHTSAYSACMLLFTTDCTHGALPACLLSSMTRARVRACVRA